jgi:hypothetical protein
VTDLSCCLRRLLSRSYETMTEESAKKSKVSSSAGSVFFSLLDQIESLSVLLLLHLSCIFLRLWYQQ